MSSKIQTVRLDEIHPDPNNDREHDEKNLAAIKASLKQFGQVEPLVVQASRMRVLGGNGRLQVMKDLGYESAQVSIVDLDDAEADALAVALNQTSDLSSFNSARLNERLAKIKNANPLAVLATGFSSAEINKRIASLAGSQLAKSPRNPDSKRTRKPAESGVDPNAFWTSLGYLDPQAGQVDLAAWLKDPNAEILAQPYSVVVANFVLDSIDETAAVIMAALAAGLIMHDGHALFAMRSGMPLGVQKQGKGFVNSKSADGWMRLLGRFFRVELLKHDDFHAFCCRPIANHS